MIRNSRYVIVSAKPWHRRAFDRYRVKLAGDWTLIDSESDFTLARLNEIKPRYIFVLHWSLRVPDEITSRFECVCFHMTDVPYGRGGSPLQNLILRGHRETKLTALQMTAGLDEGPVYLKRSFGLEGSAQEIFDRIAELSFEMADEIARTEPQPSPQTGDVVIFKRRKPAESELPREASPEQLYDFIRMLDAETYPHAFLDWGNFRLYFTNAQLRDGAVTAAVSIVERTKRDG